MHRSKRIVCAVIATCAVFLSLFWYASALAQPPARELEVHDATGITAEEYYLPRFGPGIGVAQVQAGGLADKMGIRRGRFIGKIQVKYRKMGMEKTYTRKNPSFDSLDTAFEKEGITQATIWWRKDGTWYKCTAKSKPINATDDQNPGKREYDAGKAERTDVP